jgi:hypothetical protein
LNDGKSRSVRKNPQARKHPSGNAVLLQLRFVPLTATGGSVGALPQTI